MSTRNGMCLAVRQRPMERVLGLAPPIGSWVQSSDGSEHARASLPSEGLSEPLDGLSERVGVVLGASTHEADLHALTTVMPPAASILRDLIVRVSACPGWTPVFRQGHAPVQRSRVVSPFHSNGMRSREAKRDEHGIMSGRDP